MGHHFDLADELAQGSALAYQVAKRFSLHDFLLQIGVLEFQLRLQTLDFLNGPGIGDQGGDVVGNDGTPRPGVLDESPAGVCGQHAQDLAFEGNGRETARANPL